MIDTATTRRSETKATANRPPSVHSPFAPVSLSNSASDVFCSRSAWNAPIAPVNAVNRLPLTMNDRTNEGVAPAKKAPKPPRPITSRVRFFKGNRK